MIYQSICLNKVNYFHANAHQEVQNHQVHLTQTDQDLQWTNKQWTNKKQDEPLLYLNNIVSYHKCLW